MHLAQQSPRASGSFYDPTTGAFLTRDPANAMTRSAYGYVGGSPLNGSDPSGLQTAADGGEYCWKVPNDPEWHCGDVPPEGAVMIEANRRVISYGSVLRTADDCAHSGLWSRGCLASSGTTAASVLIIPWPISVAGTFFDLFSKDVDDGYDNLGCEHQRDDPPSDSWYDHDGVCELLKPGEFVMTATGG